MQTEQCHSLLQYMRTVSQNIIGMTPPFFLADLVDYKQCTTLMMTYLLCTTLILGDGRYVMNRASRVSALRVTAAIAREENGVSALTPHPRQCSSAGEEFQGGPDSPCRTGLRAGNLESIKINSR